jgi:putative aldouronate transport system substrate-binding protein
MKMQNRIPALILALLLCVSMLAACSTPAPASTTAPTAAAATAAPTAQPTQAPLFNETGLPIVNQPTTLKITTMRWGDMGDSFKKNQWLIDLEKNTGVTIEWTAVSNTDWPEQRSILLASNQLPDVFFGNQTITDADIASNPTLFLELTDLINKYMPNYQKAITTVPAIKGMSTSPDGKIYSFGKLLPARPQTCNQPQINKDWLTKLGLAEPTTIDELEKVLIAFKNGIPNCIPLSFNGDVPVDLFNPFGITDLNNTQMSITGGDPFYYPTSQNYKDAIKWANKLWNDGVLDQEGFTQDYAKLTGKWTNADAPIVGLAFQWTPDAVFGKWSSQYESLAPLKGPDGKQYASGDKDGVFSVMRNEANITTQCKTPEVAARWIDQFYDNEASIQNFWGAIGTVITKNADGTYQLNNPPEGTSADAWYWDQSLRDFGPKFVEPSFNSLIKLNPAAGDGLKLELSKMADPFVTTPFPNVIYTADENTQLSTLTTDINGYVLQMRAEWITKGGIDAGWDAYIQKLQDMGLDKLIKIRMDAYARYTK